MLFSTVAKHEIISLMARCPLPVLRVTVMACSEIILLTSKHSLLNPHAGENGQLGTEDLEIIQPVIHEWKDKGHIVMGPSPADGFFGTKNYQNFDGVLAMYHDQGLIPFKTLAFDQGVNYTAGLNIVRTSPDHGTGYDIAGQNVASPTSFRNAVFLALDVIKSRREN